MVVQALGDGIHSEIEARAECAPAAEPPSRFGESGIAAMNRTAALEVEAPRVAAVFASREPEFVQTAPLKPDVVAEALVSQGVSPALFLLIVSYASAVTLVCLYLAYRVWTSPSTLDLPDLAPPKVSGKKVAALQYLPPKIMLPASNVLPLGDSRQFGSVRVTPLRVMRGEVEFLYYDTAKDETKPPAGPVLKLYLRFENVSQDQEVIPLDRQLVFTKELGADYGIYKANNFVCNVPDRTRLSRHVYVYDMSPDSEWLMKGQNLDRELKPGETFETFIATTEEQIDRLQGALVWRVHFRKGYNPQSYRGVTTLIEVPFLSSDIVDEEASQAAPEKPAIKDA